MHAFDCVSRCCLLHVLWWLCLSFISVQNIFTASTADSPLSCRNGLLRVSQKPLGCFHTTRFLPFGSRTEPTATDHRLHSILNAADRRTPQTPLEVLSKLIECKKYEVQELLKAHSDSYDPLQARLLYLQHTLNTKLSEQLRVTKDPTIRRRISIFADMKRKSPTIADPKFRHILNYQDAGDVALTMASNGFDGIFVNTDAQHWGGSIQDLQGACRGVHPLGRKQRPAIVMKDIILHPMQIALALENKADGVLLNAMVLGQDLEEMLSNCMIMGTEAIVEVHTVSEAQHAMSSGATILLVNQWDRTEGRLKPNQALKVLQVIPKEIITIAAGGIKTLKQVEEVATAGFDAVCLGRKLVDEDVPTLVKAAKSVELTSGPMTELAGMVNGMNERKTPDAGVEIGIEDTNIGAATVSSIDASIIPEAPNPISDEAVNLGNPQKPPVGLAKYNVSTYADTLRMKDMEKTIGPLSHIADNNSATRLQHNRNANRTFAEEALNDDEFLKEFVDELIGGKGVRIMGDDEDTNLDDESDIIQLLNNLDESPYEAESQEDAKE